MFRVMLKSKLHRVRVTGTSLHYVGSITIDEDLMEAVELIENELVQVVNVNTGARFDTYAIPGKRGSGVIELNGAAARLAEPGDLVIIMAFGWFGELEIKNHTPLVVTVDDENHIAAYLHNEAEHNLSLH
ncbi:aspartate 1-decarboxylase [Alicyclobacillaceae bacterium I2511]|nr:aspartate 1-decarboxylase [Alicyclobacillaceae bacterium I2511]